MLKKILFHFLITISTQYSVHCAASSLSEADRFIKTVTHLNCDEALAWMLSSGKEYLTSKKKSISASFKKRPERAYFRYLKKVLFALYQLERPLSKDEKVMLHDALHYFKNGIKKETQSARIPAQVYSYPAQFGQSVSRMNRKYLTLKLPIFESQEIIVSSIDALFQEPDLATLQKISQEIREISTVHPADYVLPIREGLKYHPDINRIPSRSKHFLELFNILIDLRHKGLPTSTNVNAIKHALLNLALIMAVYPQTHHFYRRLSS